jgi:hypothetical protein
VATGFAVVATGAAAAPPSAYAAIASCLVKHGFKVQKSHGPNIGWYMIASITYPTANGVKGYDLANISVQPTVAGAKEQAKTFRAFSNVDVTRVGKIAYAWGARPQRAHARILASCVAHATR